ncbi:MAG: alpha-L-rhamnosidase C-terminal domain-containing protein [Kiritimatiellia bacterium]
MKIRTILCICIVSPVFFALALTPEDTMCELLAKPALVPLTDPSPEFSWSFGVPEKHGMQSAYQIQVASSTEFFKTDEGDMWDSGRVESGQSLFVPYAGESLTPGRIFYWRVRVWDAAGKRGRWSQVLSFKMADKLKGDTPLQYPLKQSHVRPVDIQTNAAGSVMIDFGKAAFGWVELITPSEFRKGPFVLHLGERARDGHVYRKPGGSIRYTETKGVLTRRGIYRVPMKADKMNTGGAAVKLPEELGVVTPFRYVEIEEVPFPVTVDNIRQIAIHYPFDESASSFSSSDPVLEKIYDFCKYSIKATSFAGIYVDGDRERIPYEADAYINQLCHYGVDREFTMARYSHEYLMNHPTWPTEWKQHSIMMAWTDWMYTGNTESLERSYDDLFKKKLLLFATRKKDGLLVTGGPDADPESGLRDIVDWPEGERDGFDFKPVNSVVNAFFYYNILQMADMAGALGKKEHYDRFVKLSGKIRKNYNKVFYDKEKGRYVDGEGSEHSSLHANMMPLVFNIVEESERSRVVSFVKSRRMACSVYGAQYLLEALFKSGMSEYAIHLMTRDDMRSWMNMINAGSTVTMEAWDIMLKPNLDWNHAWGAAPANIIPRYVLGVKPRRPGFKEIWIRPQVGNLEHVKGCVPTIRGFVDVEVKQRPGVQYLLNFSIPANTTAYVAVPWEDGAELRVDGKRCVPELEDGALILENMTPGRHSVRWRTEAADCDLNGKKLDGKNVGNGLFSWLPFL